MSNNAPRHLAGAVFVPHTHWDREWYEPFQVFRFRLVEALDQVLEMAEADDDFRFTLDGQAAAIEDYLAIRPENEERVRAAVARGQLSLGPWLILLDEFLCTGETIVRNLEIGTRVSEAFGGAMKVGYLPDMFGHVAQMPQILAKAGLEHTALWRGAPGRLDGHAFNWAAPDGSRVRVEYLFDGYDNGLDVLLVPERISEALNEYAASTITRWGTDPVLCMIGTDHMPPKREIMEWARGVNREDFPLRVASLEEYVTGMVNDAELPEVVGELRSHARGNILPGVISIRRPLKKAMAVAEQTVGEAERLGAAFSEENFGPFLEIAWRDIIESTAHDSVVGSGTDETVEQVQARLAESAQVARSVRDGVLARVAAGVAKDSFVVSNTLTRARVVPVEVEYAGEGADTDLVAVTSTGEVLPAQRLSSAPTVLSDQVFASEDVERVLRRIHRRELFGQDIDFYELTPGQLIFHVAEVPVNAEFDLMTLRGELAAAVAEHDGEWRVVTLAAPRSTLLVAPEVPASGVVAFTVQPAAGTATREAREVPVVAAPALAVDAHHLANELVDVRVRADGALDVIAADGTALTGVGTLVDGGDRGDSYNYGPPAEDSVISAPTDVKVTVLEEGPLRAALEIVRTYDLPVSLAEDHDFRSAETVSTPITTRVELRVGEPFVRLEASWTNYSSDHRLRLHVPLPETVTGSASEGQFHVTERGLTSEGGWGEFPIPTFPATSFIHAGSATVLLDDATEYEIVDAKEIAVTLLRAVGSISVNLHPLRDEPAGSEIPIPGGQEMGQIVSTRLAVLPSAQGWQDAKAVTLAEHFRTSGLVQRGLGAAGSAELPASGVAVDGDDVFVSSVRRVESGVEVRLVAMSGTGASATVSGDFAQVATVDLLGRELGVEAAAGSVAVELAPWEIRTLVLRSA